MAKSIIYRGLSDGSLLAAKKARHKAEEVAKSDLKYVSKQVYQGDYLVYIKKAADHVTVTGIPLLGSIMMAPGYFYTIDGYANTIDPNRLCVYRGRRLEPSDTASRMTGAVAAPGVLYMTPSKNKYFYRDHPYYDVFWVNPYDITAGGVPAPTTPRYLELLQSGYRSTGWAGKAEFTPLVDGYAIAPGMFASAAGMVGPAVNDFMEWSAHHTSELVMRYR